VIDSPKRIPAAEMSASIKKFAEGHNPPESYLSSPIEEEIQEISDETFL
jgi:hypothetical protein